MALRIVIDALLVIGAFFALAGTLGVLKMPDTFCRMQASTCITTLGMLGVAIGGLLYATLMTLFVVPCMYEIMNRRELRKVNEDELQLVDM